MATISRVLIASVAALTLVPGSWAVKSGKEHQFHNVPDGAQPQGGLVSDGAGNFYGTTASGGLGTCGTSTPYCGTVFKMVLGQDGSWKGSLIYKFKGSTDGAAPEGSLVFDSAGNLYGTTISGGKGWGTVFELSPNQDGTWTESILYSFLNGTDGAYPGSGVILDTLGNLYGSADYGGCNAMTCDGVVFKLAPNQGSWTESILYTFLGGADGSSPSALAFDAAGNLFGTTPNGGNAQSRCGGCGTVFELSPSQGGSWTKTILHSFTYGLDGAYPESGVTFDSAGNLYGEAPEGGSLACPLSGCGVVYELVPGSGGWTFSVAYTFKGLNGSTGLYPNGGLALDSAGNFYGATEAGGNTLCYDGYGCGTIFELSPKVGGRFAFKLIGAFNDTDGAVPETGVIVDSKGNLYGTTYTGGDLSCSVDGVAGGCGVVFEITP